ncbi:MAG: hypothetical protein V4439_00585 [Patescibacteria group bacterium]
MLLVYISDCHDPNARGRLEIRCRALLGGLSFVFIGVSSELEASGCLIDAIDALKGIPCIIIVNVAPRGDKKKHPNGIPFCFSKVGDITIIGTPNCFSLAKKIGILSTTSETDVLRVCKMFLEENEARRIANSQFRSYEYLPYLAKWLSEGKDIPATKLKIADFGKKDFIWYVDCFGNCKTTIFSKKGFSRWSNRGFRPKFYEKLADIPSDDPRSFVVKGSSGYGNKRFFEIVCKGRSASETLGYCVGKELLY